MYHIPKKDAREIIQSHTKICKYSFSRSGVLLSRKAPLIHFYSYSVFFFFPDIPAITIINQKNGCLQFINVKLSASSASTAARCARSHQITFLPSPVHQKSSGKDIVESKGVKPCLSEYDKARPFLDTEIRPADCRKLCTDILGQAPCRPLIRINEDFYTGAGLRQRHRISVDVFYDAKRSCAPLSRRFP